MATVQHSIGVDVPASTAVARGEVDESTGGAGTRLPR